MSTGFHERFDREEKMQSSSDRTFCLVFAALFFLFAALRIYQGHDGLVWLGAAAIFLLTGLLKPGLAGPLNRLWMKLGLALAKLTNPIFLALIYIVAFVPIGLLMRLLGKDPLRLRFNAKAASYWQERTPAGPDPQTMNNQF